jgi:hypothetical protein
MRSKTGRPQIEGLGRLADGGFMACDRFQLSAAFYLPQQLIDGALLAKGGLARRSQRPFRIPEGVSSHTHLQALGWEPW